MHAGTCQVEGRVAGGGRAGGGALALWPGAPCGCGPTSCEREAHPSSHHVLCVIVCVVCRLMLLHAPKSYRSPGASSSGVCDTALERSFSRRPRPRVSPPAEAATHSAHETHVQGRGGRGGTGAGGPFKPGRARVASRAGLSVQSHGMCIKRPKLVNALGKQLKQKTRCTRDADGVPAYPSEGDTRGHRRRACTVEVLHETRMRRTRWRCLSWPGARLEP